MAYDRREQAEGIDVAACFGHAVGKCRDRYANIGREHLCARPEPAGCPIGVVAGLPEPAPVLRPFGPFEVSSPFTVSNLYKGLDLLARTLRRAVELQEERRNLRQARCEQAVVPFARRRWSRCRRPRWRLRGTPLRESSLGCRRA